MRVHHVEGVVGEIQSLYVRGHERDVRLAPRLRLGASQIQSAVGLFDSGDLSGVDLGGEVRGNGPGTTTHIEHRHTRSQMRQQITGGVFRGAYPMRAQHRFVMPVGVDGLMLTGHCVPPVRSTRRRHQVTGAVS
jgi:hypothetical protein